MVHLSAGPPLPLPVSVHLVRLPPTHHDQHGEGEGHAQHRATSPSRGRESDRGHGGGVPRRVPGDIQGDSHAET